jgi:hypothetical protein
VRIACDAFHAASATRRALSAASSRYRLSLEAAMRYATISLFILLTGCASGLSVSVPTNIGPGQTADQMDRDSTECDRAAPQGDQRETVYTGCMVARGYWTTVSVGPAFMDVLDGSRRPAATVAEDIGTCRNAPKTGMDSGRAAGAILLGGAMGYVGIQVQEAFEGCMRPKGYDVRPWRGRR